MWDIRTASSSSATHAGGLPGSAVRRTLQLLCAGLGLLGCADSPPEDRLSIRSQAQDGDSCVTVRFERATTDNPLFYSEAGVRVTSEYSEGPHLHFEYGHFLYNHADCCSTPYRFVLDTDSTFGPRFRVQSADFRNLTGRHSFSTSEAPGGVSFTPTNGVGVPFPAEFSNITWFKWQVDDGPGFGSGEMDNLVICPASAGGGTCDRLATAIGHPLSEITDFAVSGTTGRCEASITGSSSVDATSLAEAVALHPTGAGSTPFENQKYAACAVLHESLLLCKNGTYQQSNELLVTRTASCHPNADVDCNRHSPNFTQIFSNANSTFSGGTTTAEDSYCTGQVTGDEGYSLLVPDQPMQWYCTDDEVQAIRDEMAGVDKMFGWLYWPFNGITGCDGQRFGTPTCNLCRMAKAFMRCVEPNLGASSVCDVPGVSDKGRRYNLTEDYCLRMVQLRGGTDSSTHHDGRAFDLNNYAPDNAHHNNGNVFSSGGHKTMNQSFTARIDLPPQFVSVMEACGFEWGGRWWRTEGLVPGCDPMHFELPPAQRPQ